MNAFTRIRVPNPQSLEISIETLTSLMQYLGVCRGPCTHSDQSESEDKTKPHFYFHFHTSPSDADSDTVPFQIPDFYRGEPH